jgi:hypothetical protein
MKGVFLMELDDHDDLDSLADDLGISLHALTGISATNTMQLKITIAGTKLLALVDSGSTHTFIDDQVVRRLGLDIMLRLGLSMKVANGGKVQSYGVCKATSLDVQGEQFSVDCYALPLEGFEIILGVHWLKSLGPIVWDFAALSMAFYRDGRAVCFCGVDSAPLSLHAIHTTRNLMEALLLDFADIFEVPHGLPPQRPHDHHIHLLPGTTLVAVHPYRFPQLLKDEVEQQCADMLAQGIIRPSTSLFSSPVLLVKKPDGTWRFCVDYRALNNKTVKDKFPIPVVDELLDELRGAKFFTKIDLHSGYHQVRMHPDNIAKTAFRTHQGHFEFTVMPFGLTNAPATFQSSMNELLKAYICKFVLVFFDDILIYSSTWAEHLQHVKMVFQLMRAHRLFIKQSKYVFGSTSVAYLGHIISADGVAMDSDKVLAVASWPTPRTVKALRGFLGLSGYYRKFIIDYSAVA